MRQIINKFAIFVGIALVLFTGSILVQAHENDYRGDYRYNRPTEQWVRQRGYEKGFNMGLNHGNRDCVSGRSLDYRGQEYEYALSGFNPNWIHDDNYKKGFREGYRSGYVTGYTNSSDYRRNRECDNDRRRENRSYRWPRWPRKY